MTAPDARIVVVGAGQAGAALVAKLRELGHEGPITLAGDEPYPPYQRPPLSKAYLKGEMARERLYLRPLSYYDDENITLLTGQTAIAIDREARIVTLRGGVVVPYDRLALTTGAQPRRLTEEMGVDDLDGVHVMRTLADADQLAYCLSRGSRRALIVGGGYIGLEAAAVLRERGLAVTLIESAPRILARVAAPETAAYFRDLHRRHDVDVREGTSVREIHQKGGTVSGATLDDGTGLPADLILVGIGIAPDVTLAAEAGLDLDNGIRVDSAGRTSDPAIFAAGDCASFPYRNRRIRLESVPNAIDQAEIVAAAMLDRDVSYTARPWFWSDQYDVKLQIAGLNTGYDRVVLRPGARAGSQSVWYYSAETLLAVDAMNAPREYMSAKRWIEAGHSPDPEAMADPARDLKSLA